MSTPPTPIRAWSTLVEEGSRREFTDCCKLFNCVFVCLCSLKKNYHERPNYVQLLEHRFIVENETKDIDISAFVTEVLDKYGTKSKSA